MKITIVGYMGAGKTSFGRAFAKASNLPFIDLDEYIAQEYKASIPQLMQKKGELAFRKIERVSLVECLNQPSFVLSTGGGTPVFYDNMEVINKMSTSVYLRATPRELASRLENTQQTRPLIEHLENKDLTEFVAKHLFERGVYYQNAHYTLQAAASIAENTIILNKYMA